MQEILFRGKRLDNGTWVEGNYTKIVVSNFMLTDRCVVAHYINPCDGYSMFEVVPETVGQFIGRLDKNNKKIFEGDILNITFELDAPVWGPGHKWSEYAYIVWNQERFGWYAKFGEICGVCEAEELSMWEYDSEDTAVVGNIYDNPELICDEGGTNE